MSGTGGTTRRRNGGDLVVETLQALGAGTVFGLPGQHALGAFDALRRSGLAYVGGRTETGAAFAADGHARITGTPCPLLVSTGPGALFTLPALQEARAASVPVVGIGSQIPAEGLGNRRRGFLHELPDQTACFREVAKSVEVVRTASQLVDAVATAWQVAQSPPYGPTWVEVPEDLLRADTTLPAVGAIEVEPSVPMPRAALVAEAVRLLDAASRPVILAGGGVLRAGAQAPLRRLAERLRAPVATTFGAPGVFPRDHPLSVQSWLEDRAVTELCESADVLLVVGSGLGELSSNYHTMAPRGRVVQVDADRGVLEANLPALGLHADARVTLGALAEAVTPRPPDGNAEQRVAAVLATVRDRIDGQGLEKEQRVLASVRKALPSRAASCWDMTILGYWAWSAWDPREGPMLSAQGAGGLGYAYPAALGTAAASRTDAPAAAPVLAVSGDGGAMYGIAELATAREHDLDVTWLIVDDGGYGILREYMTASFGAATATELARPDFVALAESFGVPATRSSVESLADDLAQDLARPGPGVVVLPAVLRMFAPTHL
ncbi:MAG TPA: thiamine pyrophosphate-binding protein [Nocardioidaceae bacterium]|nr:thiamine pyrophosphate-binding protein [Nocardioidaceae bacterium]